MTRRAVLDGVVLAQSDAVVSLEGNAYFPADSVRWEHLTQSPHTTVCPWKGKASYFDAEIGDTTHRNIGWTYLTPSRKAREITGHVAFWGAAWVESVA